MQIHLNHPKYRMLTLTEQGLTLHNDRKLPLFPDKVLETAVTVSNDQLHVAALLQDYTILHWWGNEELHPQAINTEAQPKRGLKLVTDSAGIPHIFYLEQNQKRSGYTLMQHTFQTNDWSDGIRVTGNISSDPKHWHVCFGVNQTLHLVYANQELDTLFYRMTDMKTKTWSGAIPLVQEQVEDPQIYVAQDLLVIFWVSNLEQGKVVRAIVQEGTWGKPSNLSSIAKDIFQPGVNLESDQPTIIWMQGGKLWSASYAQQWSQPEQFAIEARQAVFQTVLAKREQSSGCCILRVYRQLEPLSQQTGESAQIKPTSGKITQSSAPEIDQAAKERREVERRFFAEAFQLHQEWQAVKAQYTQFLQNQQALSEKISHELRQELQEWIKTEYAQQTLAAIQSLREEIQAQTERIRMIREEIRSLKLSQTQNQGKDRLIEQVQGRLEKLEVSVRAKVSEQQLLDQLKELKARISRVEQELNPPQTKTVPRRTLLQKILSRL